MPPPRGPLREPTRGGGRSGKAAASLAEIRELARDPLTSSYRISTIALRKGAWRMLNFTEEVLRYIYLVRS